MKTACFGAIYTIGTEPGCPNSPILSMAKGIESVAKGDIVFIGGTGTDALPALAALKDNHPRFDFSRVKERTEQAPILNPDKAPQVQLYTLGAIGYLSPSLNEVLEFAVEGADLLCIDFWCEREWIRALTELKKDTGCRIAWHISWARSTADMAAAAECADILILSSAEAGKLNACSSATQEQLIVLQEETEDAYLQAGIRLAALIREPSS